MEPWVLLQIWLTITCLAAYLIFYLPNSDGINKSKNFRQDKDLNDAINENRTYKVRTDKEEVEKVKKSKDLNKKHLKKEFRAKTVKVKWNPM